MFSLDLDEIDQVVSKVPLISRNRFNIFAFNDRDHLQLAGYEGKSAKENILEFLKQNSVDSESVVRIQLVTNLSTFGYQFNPVSFYYCFDSLDNPICSVAEVSNTYREMKLFFLGSGTLDQDEFTSIQTKNFYVSPFIDLDTHFDFHLGVPKENLHVRIDDYKAGNRFFLSTLEGKRKPLTSWNTLKYAVRFPFIPLQIMGLIHWQAFKLWLLKIGHHKKAANKHLQLDVLKPHS